MYNIISAIVFGTSSVLKHMGTPIINIIDTTILSASTARNLGYVQDNKLGMDQHIDKVYHTGFYNVRNIRKVCCYLTEEVTEQMVHTFVTSRLDQCSSLPYSIPDHLVKKLWWLNG